MEKHICLLVLSLVTVSLLVGSHASVSPEAYWKLLLPNTPMPQSIQDSLPVGPPVAAESPSKTTDVHGELVADTKASLRTLNGYDGLLSYTKGSLKTLNGYDGLLSYSKESLKTLNGYDGLLSYSKGSLKTLNGYDGLLSYTKGSLKTLNGYDGLLSYNQKQKPLESDNGYLSYNQEKYLPAQAGYLSYSNQKKEPESESTDVPSSQVQDSAMKNRQFFMEKDLQIGNKKNLEFKIGTNKGVFLPREVSNTIPFSSDKLQEILRILSLDPKSEKAFILSRRIKLCEEPTVQGVEKQCVTSLESMVDYVTSKLGKNVKAMSTKVEKDAKGEYKIAGVNKLTKEDHETVVCHKMDYPYAVYFCHRTDTIRSYMVSLVGEDGAKMEAVSACHKEINAVLEDYEINVLKVKPRSARICHFPNSESIIWVRN